MTINPIEMQVIVPRAGEVERVNRTAQGQQQTDQQIMNQLIQENLKHQEQAVNQLNPTEQNRIQSEEEKKEKENKEKEKQEKKAADSAKKAEKNSEQKYTSNKGRYLDIKI